MDFEIQKAKDYVVVTALSTFRMRYVMHKDDLQEMNPEMCVDPIEWAQDTFTMNECEEFSQEHMGEYIIDTAEMTEDDMLELFDKENEYLSKWRRDKKITWVRGTTIRNIPGAGTFKTEFPVDVED
jgi:hypothetical protein